MLRHTALLTGGSGFIGSHLTQRLLASGWNVHLIVRPTSSLAALDGVLERLAVSVHTCHGSSEEMLAIMESVGPDVVFHLASLFLPSHASSDIDSLISSNVAFGVQLVDAMAVTGVTKLVNTGTSWQHFGNAGYDPACLYAATKQAFEAILDFYVNTASVRAITLKLFDTYGPNDSRPKLLNLLASAGKDGQPLLMSPGAQLVDLVYIDDVVECYVLAAERLLAGQVAEAESYAVSSGRPIALREVVETYEGIAGRKIPIQWGGRPYRPREIMAPWSKGQLLPGWRPKVGLEEGIRIMLSR